MSSVGQSLLGVIDRYYSDKLRMHGPTPPGVDWNGPDSQQLRFTQLMKLACDQWSASLNDVGCGYGALYDFLLQNNRQADYLGIDVSQEMIAAAQKLHPNTDHCRFIVGTRPNRVADYTVTSGIFNVRPGIDKASWRTYINDVLDTLRESSAVGFDSTA